MRLANFRYVISFHLEVYMEIVERKMHKDVNKCVVIRYEYRLAFFLQTLIIGYLRSVYLFAEEMIFASVRTEQNHKSV